MLKSRLFEQVVTRLWKEGLISGEMHLGTGEEAIVAGIVAQLAEGDAMCLDHRGTPPLLMRGVDPSLILRELLGRPDGLCGGKGGHMHLLSKAHLIASSGIVGAAGPTATGFALAAQYLRSGNLAVAFFGDGAMNQGMLMESMNLAAAWNLPVLFVCKDDGWAITTPSRKVTGGDLAERARGLGLEAMETDGRDVSQVWEAAHRALERIRSGKGAVFLRACCVHREGHFLGYQLLKATRDPVKELPGIAVPLTRSLVQSRGGAFRERLAGLQIVLGSLLTTLRDPRDLNVAPLVAWGQRILACFDQPEADWPTSEPDRVHEKLDWVKRFRSALAEWAELFAVSTTTESVVRHQGLTAETPAVLAQRLQPLVHTERGQRIRQELLTFVTAQAALARPKERLVGSSEVIESVLGKLKRIEQDQATGGFTGLVLSLGAIVSQTTEAVIQKALETVSTQDVWTWCHETLGTSVQAQRRQLMKLLKRAEQKGDQLPATT